MGNWKIKNFEKCACFEKYLKDNEHSGLHLARKCVRIFVLGHYLFVKAHTVCFSEQIMSGDKYPSIVCAKRRLLFILNTNALFNNTRALKFIT